MGLFDGIVNAVVDVVADVATIDAKIAKALERKVGEIVDAD